MNSPSRPHTGHCCGALPADPTAGLRPFADFHGHGPAPFAIDNLSNDCNALIARSGMCLVAIGGGMGTISEAALGLKWGKPVFALYEDIQLPGA